MADPFAKDPNATFGSDTHKAKDSLNARFDDLRRDAAGTAKTAADTVSRQYGTGDARADVKSAASSVRDEAAATANDAKSAASTLADQARARIAEIVDQQKAAGADKISGVAKAAQSAAKDLDQANPQMARLVRSAAESVDRVADDLRSRDIGDVLDTLAAFGRQQPVAFFGGAVVAGFLLARFFKSDAPVVRADGFGQV